MKKYRILWQYSKVMSFHSDHKSVIHEYETVEQAVKEAIALTTPFLIVQVIDWEAKEI